MKALVVENDLMSQCVLAKLLGERGHSVVCFENAEQAVLACEKEQYPLVFVAVSLPGMDGLQFCRWLRGQPFGARTYIMAAASPGQPSDLSQVLAAGASDFLLKPYDVGTLRVRLAVGKRQCNSHFRELEIEEQLARRNQEWEGLQSELRQSAERITRESEARIQAEELLEVAKQELAETRAAFDERLTHQAAQLCASADELQSATTFRNKIEEDLKKVRVELEGQVKRHEEARRVLEKDLLAEKDLNRRMTDESLRVREALLVRVEELTQAARQADQRRQEMEVENRRVMDALTRGQAEWDIRQRELTAQVDRARQEGECVGDARSAEKLGHLEKELAAVRQEFSQRLQRNAEDLLKLDDELKRALADRRRLEAEVDELLRSGGAGEGTSGAAASPALGVEMVKGWVSEAIKDAMAEQAQDTSETELTHVREALASERERRKQAEAALQRARVEFQEQLRKVVSSLEPVETSDCVSVA